MSAKARVALAAGTALALSAFPHLHSHRHDGGAALASAGAPLPHAAKAAIRYAEHQLGKPYLWGGTGPGSFDCSGLVMEAYAHAGITIPRTSQLQSANLPHVPASKRGPGDLVFFAGSDGTPASPGHVGILIGRNRMIEAYAAGFPVRITVFGKPSSPPGDQNPAGYADPVGG